jgi:hypothetical protein
LIDGSHLLLKLRQILDGFLDAVVGDIVGGQFGALKEVIAHDCLIKPFP